MVLRVWSSTRRLEALADAPALLHGSVDCLWYFGLPRIAAVWCCFELICFGGPASRVVLRGGRALRRWLEDWGADALTLFRARPLLVCGAPDALVASGSLWSGRCVVASYSLCDWLCGAWINSTTWYCSRELWAWGWLIKSRFSLPDNT